MRSRSRLILFANGHSKAGAEQLSRYSTDEHSSVGSFSEPDETGDECEGSTGFSFAIEKEHGADGDAKQTGHIGQIMRVWSPGNRISNQRNHPAITARIARGMWLSSARNSSLTLPSECEWVSKSAPPAAHTKRKYEARPRWESRPVLHRPLEDTKGDDQQDKEPVLSHFRYLKALPKAARTEGPVLRVALESAETPPSQEMSAANGAPTGTAAQGRDRNTGRKHHQACPVVIVFRPRDVGSGVGLNGLARNRRIRSCRVPRRR